MTDDEGEVRELTKADFRRARPAAEVLPEVLGKKRATELLKRRPGQRGPQRAPVKQPVTLRLDPDVLAFFKDAGPGWQTRINEALKRVVRRMAGRVRPG